MLFWKHHSGILFIAIFGALGLFQSFYPTFLSGFTHLQSDLGDTRFNHYLLEHSYRWISGAKHHESLWDPPFFFPAPNVLAYSDMLLGVAPIYWILRFFDASEVESYQIWMIVQQVLTYGLSLVLLRRLLCCSWIAASLGSYLIAFANPRLAQLGHQQLLPLYFILLALVCCVELSRDHQAKWHWIYVPLGGTCLFLQVITGFYYAWFTALFATLLISIALLHPQMRQDLGGLLARMWRPIVATAIVCGAALVPVIGHYLQAVAEVGMRDFGEVAAGIPHLSHLLHSGSDNYLWGWLRGAWTHSLEGFYQEKQLGVGIVTLFAALFGIWKVPSNKVRTLVTGVFFGSVLLAFVLPSGVLLWQYLYHVVPGAAAVRAPGRIILFLLVVYGIGIASLVEYWVKKGRSSFVVLLFALVMVLEQTRFMPSYEVKNNLRTVERLARAVRSFKRCEAFLILQEKGRFTPEKYQLDAMWAGLRVGIPTINGYSGNSPSGWGLSPNVFGTHEEYDDLVLQARRWEAGFRDKEVCLLRRDRYGSISRVRFSDRSKEVLLEQ